MRLLRRKNGIQPLLKQSADFGRAFTAITSGVEPAKIAIDALKGKFGPLLQVSARVGVAIGTMVKIGLGIFRGFADGVGSVMSALVGGIRDRIAHAVNIFRRLSAIPGIAARAIGGFVSSVAAGLGRAVSAVGSGTGRIVSTIGQLPGRAVGVLGGMGSRLFSSGAALIQGFITASLARSATSPVSQDVRSPQPRTSFRTVPPRRTRYQDAATRSTAAVPLAWTSLAASAKASRRSPAAAARLLGPR